jgi:HK97 family phage prohead protease
MKLSPSLAQRELAAMEARLSALERGRPRPSVARQAADMVSCEMGIAPHAHLTEDSISAGLGYCHWLRSKQFADRLTRLAPSARAKRTPVTLLSGDGEYVYRLVANYLRKSVGATWIGTGECEAVRRYLHDLKQKAPRRANHEGSHGRKELQLASVTKFVSGGKRMLRGLANSGLTDRVGDVVEPKGGKWTLPLPLLWQHKHDQPIGWVRSVEAKADGLWITAEIAEGIGKADEAWRMIEAGLVDSYSVGFQAHDWEPLPTGGKRFTSWSLLEVSVVTVPADARAKIRRNVTTLPHRSAGASVAGHPGSVSLIRSNTRG